MKDPAKRERFEAAKVFAEWANWRSGRLDPGTKGHSDVLGTLGVDEYAGPIFRYECDTASGPFVAYVPILSEVVADAAIDVPAEALLMARRALAFQAAEKQMVL
jgi:hypothetical protein